ncbi:MAG TPA: hypothetical protein VFO57_06120 [Burkholderiales bacterium]|nr:hypothetical protein [Burkholderiales bacterium]
MSRARFRCFALAGLCLWLAAAGTVSQAGAPPGWKEVAIPAGRFKVLMPGAPKTSRQTIRTDIGNVAATRYTVTDNANVTYDVLFNEYPAAGVAKVNPQKLLDSARDGLLYQTKGKMVSEKHITLSGFPGREQIIMSGEGTHYRVRLAWAGNRLYQVMAVSPGKPRPDAELFFDSFQIVGKR